MNSESDLEILEPENFELVPAGERLLTKAEFQRLSDVPPEAEWFANIENKNTRAAYTSDVNDFRRFVGIEEITEFRLVTRAHVIAWKKELERRGLKPATIRRRMSAVSSLFAHLTDCNAIGSKSGDGSFTTSRGCQ